MAANSWCESFAHVAITLLVPSFLSLHVMAENCFDQHQRVVLLGAHLLFVSRQAVHIDVYRNGTLTALCSIVAFCSLVDLDLHCIRQPQCLHTYAGQAERSYLTSCLLQVCNGVGDKVSLAGTARSAVTMSWKKLRPGQLFL